LPKDAALINRMGFNNDGIDAMLGNLKALKQQKIIIGGNIGKNKITPNEDATTDYEICFNALFDHVDYFVLNVSSPNTPDLRALQDKEPLQKLLSHIQVLNQARSRPKPLLLKIAPDLNESQLLDIVEIVCNTQLSGIVATNTTIDRSHLKTTTTEVANIGMGGLSGKPVRVQSTAIIAFLRKHLPKPFCIIGVGGIDSAETAQEKLDAGADLVQIYTGLVYEGPGLVRKINEGLK
jgi:dihydroorotate dehydrogenase